MSAVKKGKLRSVKIHTNVTMDDVTSVQIWNSGKTSFPLDDELIGEIPLKDTTSDR